MNNHTQKKGNYFFLITISKKLPWHQGNNHSLRISKFLSVLRFQIPRIFLENLKTPNPGRKFFEIQKFFRFLKPRVLRYSRDFRDCENSRNSEISRFGSRDRRNSRHVWGHSDPKDIRQPKNRTKSRYFKDPKNANNVPELILSGFG